MVSRRAALAGTAALTACTTAVYTMGRPVDVHPPAASVNFELPHGACDSHVHVIGDPNSFPMSPERVSTPPAATADQLLQMQQFLGLSRVVIVTPAIYTDNAATIAAVKQLGRHRARGVGWLPETKSSEILRSMREAGIVGFRVLLYEGGHFDVATAAQHLKAKFDLAERWGWHLDIVAPPDIVAALQAQLELAPVPLVLDTFGWVAGGVTQQGFHAVLSLVRSGRSYVKLSEPYRLSNKGPDYPDLLPLVQAFVAANPDRVLWGSGWPYVSGASPGRNKTDLAPDLPIDAGHLLNVFAEWVPDAEIRHRFLVENPARLYGF